jgi:Protein of unknown function (DUF1203)
MTSFEYLPVPAADLDRIRCNGRDDHSHAVVAKVAGGGEPLRCCLTIASEGERIALISYQPSSLGGPYAEIGPVFIHVDACGGPARATEFPEDYRDRNAVLRAYDAQGQMLDGLLVKPGEGEAGVKHLLEDPQVALVHHRNVVAGCWNFSVRRAG